MVIMDRTDPAYWAEVYRGAREAASRFSAVVEKAGDERAGAYDAGDYIDIAIASGVDGIAVYVGDAEEITPHIDSAIEAGIPVVALENDAVMSKRSACVGVNGFELGERFGELILERGRAETEVTLLVDTVKARRNAMQDLILAGIREVLYARPDIRVRNVVVERTNPFRTEETIRDLFLSDETKLDVLVCLNAEDTVRAAQTLIDLNRVGDVSIIGYRENGEVLDYIHNGVVFAAVASDAYRLGSDAAESLHELLIQGWTNEYQTTTLSVVRIDNVDSYRDGH
jgi:ribose transport system substrate-binding protein